MYYITNENHEIIATDQAMLDFVNADNFMDFYTKLQNKKIKLFFDNNSLEITLDGSAYTYPAQLTSLQTPMGKMVLTSITKEIASNEINLDDTTTLAFANDSQENQEKTLSDAITLANEPITKQILPKQIQPNEDTFNEENFLALLDDLPDDTIPIKETSPTHPIAQETIALQEVDHTPTIKQPISNEAILVDAKQISEILGISENDYEVFLQEYIQTAYALRQSLESPNKHEQTQALETLEHLTSVLHLPTEFKKSLEEPNTGYAKFYNQLENLQIAKNGLLESEFLKPIEESLSQQEEEILFQLPPQPTQAQEKPLELLPQDKPLELLSDDIIEEDLQSKSAFGETSSIDLLGVKPEHFDFQIEEAAKELSLPLDLVKEFIKDFIEQVHEETKNILIAHQEGELPKIQKLAHMLKGTSSNLRITPLADSLYDLQLNEDLNQVEPLVKKYWGQFISFERLMSGILNQGATK